VINIEKCIEFMKQKHMGQKRKQGTEYYLHPLSVYELLKTKGFDEEFQAAGLFHDLIEDTDATYEEIIELTNKKVAEAVRCVTKESGYTMNDYIERIEKDSIAKMVKLADRVHNLSEAWMCEKNWIEEYINETEKWYVSLAKDTIFEEELKNNLEYLKKVVKEK